MVRAVSEAFGGADVRSQCRPRLARGVSLIVIDEVKEKRAGTKLASYDWRPMQPVDGVEYEVTKLIREAFERCEDQTDALIVVTVASVLISRRHGMGKAHVSSQTMPPVRKSKWWHRFKSNR